MYPAIKECLHCKSPLSYKRLELTQRIYHRATVGLPPIVVKCGSWQCNHRIGGRFRCNAVYHHNWYSYNGNLHFYPFKPEIFEVGKNFMFSGNILEDFMVDTFIKHTTGVQHVDKYNILHASELPKFRFLVKGTVKVQAQLTNVTYHKAVKLYLLHKFLVTTKQTDIAFPNSHKPSSLLAHIQDQILVSQIPLHHLTARAGIVNQDIFIRWRVLLDSDIYT